MYQATVLVSAALELVITKLVAAVIVVMRRKPGVPPSTCEVKKIRLLAVTEVLATVLVPATNTAVPILALAPVLTCNPLPIVLISKLPVDTFTSPVNIGAAKVLTPAKVCAPVVTTPPNAALAGSNANTFAAIMAPLALGTAPIAAKEVTAPVTAEKAVWSAADSTPATALVAVAIVSVLVAVV